MKYETLSMSPQFAVFTIVPNGGEACSPTSFRELSSQAFDSGDEGSAHVAWASAVTVVRRDGQRTMQTGSEEPDLIPIAK